MPIDFREIPAAARKILLLVEDSERRNLIEALVQSDGNKAEAARRLGIPRSTYYSKLKKYGAG